MNYEIEIKKTSSQQYYWTLITESQNIVSPEAFARKVDCYNDLQRLMNAISSLLGQHAPQLGLAV